MVCLGMRFWGHAMVGIKSIIGVRLTTARATRHLMLLIGSERPGSHLVSEIRSLSVLHVSNMPLLLAL